MTKPERMDPADVVERAQAALNDYELVKANGVSVAPGRAYRLIPELVAEVERLRYDADHFTKQLQDALDPGAGDEWDADDVIAIVRELEAEVERLHSWDGLMSLVEEHYPEDIFPTMDDHPARDPGPRIISLLRQLDHLRGSVGEVHP